MAHLYYRCRAIVTDVDGGAYNLTFYGQHSDSTGLGDTMDYIPQAVRDALSERDSELFDAPIDHVEVEGRRIISEADYYRAPRAQVFI